ncbi:hypothetical protein [Microbispora sp. NPDC049125]|uniref:hypothetical protein n=1 Tax=Microbispora sp. NPDC049125 TaxID=3154929 RepID=UPI0034671035
MRIVALIWALSDEAFAEIDAFAWVQRWQIRRSWQRHTYRDRRFDAVIACRACQATGQAPTSGPCPSCGGTGRLNLLEPVVSPNKGSPRPPRPGRECPEGGRT